MSRYLEVEEVGVNREMDGDSRRGREQMDGEADMEYGMECGSED